MFEKVVTACPVVRSDPAALAMLQDPELFMGLTNPDNLNKYGLPRIVLFYLLWYLFFHHTCLKGGEEKLSDPCYVKKNIYSFDL